MTHLVALAKILYFTYETMKCIHPRYLNQRFRKDTSEIIPAMLVPCGKCIYCRLANSLQWSVRVQKETQYCPRGCCFLTLTIDSEHLKYTKLGKLTLSKKQFQDFMKRLRIYLERHNIPQIRGFFACGEYGSKRGRPHYHVLLFDYMPDDLVFYKLSYSGYPLYTSKTLSSIWKNGLVFVGTSVKDGAAGYVARYTLKKQISDLSEESKWYIKRNLKPLPEFFLSSRRIPYYFRGQLKYGAIGSQWLSDNIETAKRGYLNDIDNPARLLLLPRYFQKILESNNIDLSTMKEHRAIYAEKHLKEVRETQWTRALEDSRTLQDEYFRRCLSNLRRDFEYEKN